jgi:hypothetical protein
VASRKASAASNKSPLLVLVPMGIVLAGIASLAAYFLWPRGERVGTLDLRNPATSLDVTLAAGDKLNFRLDVTVGTTSGYPDSSRSRSNAVHDELEASKLAVDLGLGGNVTGSTTCGAFDGKATSGSSSSDEVESSGLPLRCSLVARAAGKYTLSTRVVWVPKDVREAKLEVWRQRASD